MDKRRRHYVVFVWTSDQSLAVRRECWGGCLQVGIMVKNGRKDGVEVWV
jgi:hypothetical protein